MYGACNQFLAGAGFAQEQDRAVGRSNELHLREHLLEDIRVSYVCVHRMPVTHLLAQVADFTLQLPAFAQQSSQTESIVFERTKRFAVGFTGRYYDM